MRKARKVKSNEFDEMLKVNLIGTVLKWKN